MRGEQVITNQLYHMIRMFLPSDGLQLQFFCRSVAVSFNEVSKEAEKGAGVRVFLQGLQYLIRGPLQELIAD